jgi:importin-7
LSTFIFWSSLTKKFSDAMPTLHNYLTVDTETFLSKQEHIVWLLDMCQRVLNDKEAGDEPQQYAAKMLECFVLQCQGKIDTYIPNVILMANNRLVGEFEENSGELKAQLLTVMLFYLALFFVHNGFFLRFSWL